MIHKAVKISAVVSVLALAGVAFIAFSAYQLIQSMNNNDGSYEQWEDDGGEEWTDPW